MSDSAEMPPTEMAAGGAAAGGAGDAASAAGTSNASAAAGAAAASASALFGDGDDDDDHDDEDEDDDDDDPLGGPGGRDPMSALHALLGRLGATQMGGIPFGLFRESGGGKYQRLLSALEDQDNEPAQESALREVTEMLLMGNEETLGGFRIEPFVSAFHALLDAENRPQVSIQACQALCNMLEALPASSGAVAACAESLCQKLLSIEYIDLAERAQVTLSKLSVDQGRAILNAGGLNAVLVFMNFFPLNVQRVALSTAANVCKHIQPARIGLAESSIPVLNELLTHTDPTMIEPPALCFSRMVGNCSHNFEALSKLTACGLVKNLVSLLTASPRLIKDQTAAMVTRTLCTVVAKCPGEAAALLEARVADSIVVLLLGSQGPPLSEDRSLNSSRAKSAGTGVKFAVDGDALLAIVRLTEALLPPLPSRTFLSRFDCKRLSSEENVACWESQADDGSWQPFGHETSIALEAAHAAGDRAKHLTVNGTPYSVNFGEMVQQNRVTRTSRSVRRVIQSVHSAIDTDKDPRAQLFAAKPDLLVNFCEQLLCTFFELFLSSARKETRLGALQVLVRMHSIATADMLREVLRHIAVSSFLLGMLRDGDVETTAGALEIVDTLMAKLPDIFGTSLRRNGAIYEIHRLSRAADTASAAAPTSPKMSTSKPATRGSAKRGKAKASPSEPSTESANGSADRPAVRTVPARANSSAELTAMVTSQCAALIAKYFSDADCANPEKDSHTAFDQLRKVSRLSKDLDVCLADGTDELPCLGQIAEVLADEDTDITSFEALHSNLVPSLLRMVTTDSEIARSREERLRSFCKVFFTKDADSMVMFNGAVTKLLSLLHGQLNLVENFCVVGAKESHANHSHGALTQPMKLELRRDPSAAKLQDFPASLVLIEPLASIHAIEEFLWPRVRPVKATNNKWEWQEGTRWRPFDPDSERTLRALRTAGTRHGELTIRGTRYKIDLERLTQVNVRTGFIRSIRAPANSGTSAKPPADDAGPADAAVPASDASASATSVPPASAGSVDAGPATGSDASLPAPAAVADTTRVGSTDADDTAENDEIKPDEGDADHSDDDDDDDDDDDEDDDMRAEINAESDALDEEGDAADLDDDINEDSEDQEDYDDEQDDRGRGRRHRRNEAVELKLPQVGPHALLANPVLSRPNSERRLTVLLNGRILPPSMTVYQAVQAHSRSRPSAAGKSSASGRTHRVLSGLCKLTYREYRATTDGGGGPDGSAKRYKTPVALSRPDSAAAKLLQSLSVPAELPADSPVRDVVGLLWVLYTLNARRGDLDGDSGVTEQLILPSQFVNNKLSSKLARQVSDFDTICANSFPDWCHQLMATPFLAALEHRQLYFHYTAFGSVRALQHFNNLHQDSTLLSSEDNATSRLSRLKVRLSRDRIVESAFHIMYAYASRKSVLEIEFIGEVGTGLGPTLEFYSLVSQEFQLRSLDIWRAGSYTDSMNGVEPSEELEYVFSPNGLYPAPLDPALSVDSPVVKMKIRLFETLGRLLARAILDGRLLDIPLSPLFYTYMLGREAELNIHSLCEVEPTVAKSMGQLQAIGREKAKIEADPELSAEDRRTAIASLRMDGVRVEDLGLVFTLPGNDNIALVDGGAELDVTIDNVDQYVKSVIHMTMVQLVRVQMKAVRRGFNDVFPLESMHLFTDTEVAHLACGQQWQQWSTSELRSAIRADHGFTMASPSVDQLIDTLSEFGREQQRTFLQFVTGSPSLPVGGKWAIFWRISARTSVILYSRRFECFDLAGLVATRCCLTWCVRRAVVAQVCKRCAHNLRWSAREVTTASFRQ